MIETWIKITNEDQLNDIIKNSNSKPSIIYKHSTTCGISAHAMYKLETDWDKIKDKVNFYYLDLLQYRSISNKISEVSNVIHQSPQIIIYNNEQIISHFSHQVICVDKIIKEIS